MSPAHAPAPAATRGGDPTGVEGWLTQPLGQSDVFEQTLGRLVQMIKLGVLQPGDRLPAERELALRLGISRQTLREAIRSLVQAGHLETRRGRRGGSVRARPARRSGWRCRSRLRA